MEGFKSKSATMTTLFTAPPLPQSTSVFTNLSSRPEASIRAITCFCSASASSSYSRGAVRFTGRLERRVTSRAKTARVRAVQDEASTDTAGERARVKQELLSLLEQTDGEITAEGMEAIAALQKLNPNPRASEVPELVNGFFRVVRGTVKGRAAANSGVFASIFTLARAAFGAFKPLKQEVIIEEGYNHIHEGDYVLAFDISLKNRKGESPEFLRGYLLNQAKCRFADSEKLTVTFTSSLLRPAEGVVEEELQSWKRLFHEENPCMDERGWMSVKLPESDGDVDHLYVDDDLRIVQGSFKNIFVMRRLSGPVIPT